MKKNNVLEYKGYHAAIEFDAESHTLIGKIDGINDLVTFESDRMNRIDQEFHHAVDDYLEFCKRKGKEPEKEYRGTFNVRISPDLHKELARISAENGDTLNASVTKAIVMYVNEEKAENVSK